MLSLIAILAYSTKLFAAPEVVYGLDDRMDYLHMTPVHAELSKATAVMVNNIRLKKSEDHYLLSKKTLKDYGVCSDQRFIDQPIAGSCTGFLIGPKTLVTAGHCIQTMSDCKIHRWLFNYQYEKNFSYEVNSEDVYTCIKIIKRGFTHSKAIDFAIVELDREKSDVTPLKLRSSGSISTNDKTFVIGYPTGLPVKYAGHGSVRTVKNHSFVTNLDTFAGNSGSPVFNEQTLTVEGILIRGENDYIYDPKRDCKKVKICNENRCEGETVSSILNL